MGHENEKMGHDKKKIGLHIFISIRFLLHWEIVIWFKKLFEHIKNKFIIQKKN